MRSDIRLCSAHDRPVYTLQERCPDCGRSTGTSAPAPFSPADPYGRYRRALKRRNRE